MAQSTFRDGSTTEPWEPPCACWSDGDLSRPSWWIWPTIDLDWVGMDWELRGTLNFIALVRKTKGTVLPRLEETNIKAQLDWLVNTGTIWPDNSRNYMLLVSSSYQKVQIIPTFSVWSSRLQSWPFWLVGWWQPQPQPLIWKHAGTAQGVVAHQMKPVL